MGPKSASSPNAVRGATAASTPKREAAKPEKTAKIGSPGLPGLLGAELDVGNSDQFC